MLIDQLRGRRQNERIPVWICARCRVRANVSRAAGTIVDDEALAEILADMNGDEAGYDVGGASRRERHDERDRPRWKLLLLCHREHSGKEHCKHGCCEPQSPANKLRIHDAPPPPIVTGTRKAALRLDFTCAVRAHSPAKPDLSRPVLQPERALESAASR